MDRSRLSSGMDRVRQITHANMALDLGGNAHDHVSPKGDRDGSAKAVSGSGRLCLGPGAQGAARMNASVVIADDDADLAEALAEYLRPYGFAIRIVGDGAALCAALQNQPADLVLLDINMPGEDGLSLARRIRAGGFGDPAIIMLTGAVDVVDRVVGLEIGADDYIAKPCDPRELRARMRAVLRRHQSPTTPRDPPQQIAMGHKFLDLEGRCLIGPGEERQPLHAGEFALLATFATRPGRVLTREMLLDLAHPHGEEAFDRSIDVRIARIRRKLEQEPQKPTIIRTVRGVGYVFDPKTAF